MSLITELAVAAPDMAVHAGVLDLVEDKSNALVGTIKVVVTAVAVIFVVYKAIQSKFAIGTIVVSALAAGVLIWIVNSTDFLQGLIGDEIESAPAHVQVVETPTDLV